MNKTSSDDTRRSRSRNIALGAALGLVIGGGLDLLLGDSGWGLVIGILIGAITGYFVKFPLPLMEYPGYITRRMVISVILFLGTLFLSQWLLNQELESTYQYLAAVLPAIAGLFLAYSTGSAIAQLDELQRRIQLEAIGIGFGASLLVTMTYGMLVQVGFPQMSWSLVPLLMVLMWGLGKIWTIWKYR
jgi:hypothetical protein